MSVIVLCAGTATEVGKTWVGAAVLRALRDNGQTVVARKPVQSFDPSEAGSGTTDAEVLALATGEAASTVCPQHRWYELALAPPIAAELLGRPSYSDGELAAEHGDPLADVVWVETVGGPLSPMTFDGDSASTARWLHPHVVVLVADAGLGAINAVRLAAIPFAGRNVVVFLNRYADVAVCRTNLIWLRTNGFTVTTDVEALAQLIESML